MATFVATARRRRSSTAPDRARTKIVSPRIRRRFARAPAGVEWRCRRVDSRLALRRRWPGTSGAPDRIGIVLDAGRAARGTLHIAAARHRTDDAHGQTGVERRTNAAHFWRAARTAALRERRPPSRRDALSHAAISTFLALDGTRATTTDAALGRTMKPGAS